jgi:transposase
LADTSDNRIPEIARACLVALGAQLRTLKAQMLEFDRLIRDWHRSSEASKRLDEIPVGPALATALVASVGDPRAFRSGGTSRARAQADLERRQGKAWQHQANEATDICYLCNLFTTGALAVIRYAKLHGTKHRPCLTALLARRPTKVAAIALANKIARMALGPASVARSDGTNTSVRRGPEWFRNFHLDFLLQRHSDGNYGRTAYGLGRGRSDDWRQHVRIRL